MWYICPWGFGHILQTTSEMGSFYNGKYMGTDQKPISRNKKCFNFLFLRFLPRNFDVYEFYWTFYHMSYDRTGYLWVIRDFINFISYSTRICSNWWHCICRRSERLGWTLAKTGGVSSCDNLHYSLCYRLVERLPAESSLGSLLYIFLLDAVCVCSSHSPG